MTELDARTKVSVVWSRRLRKALQAEARRRREAPPTGDWKPVKWDMGTVSEDILRTALGVGDEQ